MAMVPRLLKLDHLLDSDRFSRATVVLEAPLHPLRLVELPRHLLRPISRRHLLRRMRPRLLPLPRSKRMLRGCLRGFNVKVLFILGLCLRNGHEY